MKRMLIVLTTIILIAGCGGSEIALPVTSPMSTVSNGDHTMKDQTLPHMVQGDWTVHDLQNRMIGSLNLTDEEYSFSPLANPIPDLFYKRLPFIRIPLGQITCDSLLGDKLPNEGVIAICRFEDDSEFFEIRLDQNRLFFHGEYSEFQFWVVEKMIDKTSQ